MAIRKHWKKILLALFASVWSGCTEDPAQEADLYGCPFCTCEDCEKAPADSSKMADVSATDSLSNADAPTEQ